MISRFKGHMGLFVTIWAIFLLDLCEAARIFKFILFQKVCGLD